MVPKLVAATLVPLALVSAARRTQPAMAADRLAMAGDRLAMAAPEEEEGHKEIIFVRHGQSTGNALNGAGSVKDFFRTALGSMVSKTNWPSDSVLSTTGMQQVYERVQQLQSGSLNERLLSSEVLIVSPLRRAMATSVLLVAHAYHAALSKRAELSRDECSDACDCTRVLGLQLPEVRVMIELREKVKSSSDEIGTGKGDYAYTPNYVYNVANQLEDSIFCGAHVLAPLAQKLEAAYVAEAARTSQWAKHAQDEVTGAYQGVPTNALLEATNIQYVMKRLSAMKERSFLLVGHSGWSRFAFTHLMPRKEGDGGFLGEDPNDNLKMNARPIHGLNNVGLLCVGVDSRGITGRSTADCTVEETEQLPNFDREESKKTMPALVPDAAEAGTLPRGARVRRYWIKRTDKQKLGILALSSSPESTHKWYVSWSNAWGKPKEQFALELPTGLPASRNPELPFSANVVGAELQITIGENVLTFDNDPDVKSGFEDMLAELRQWAVSPGRTFRG